MIPKAYQVVADSIRQDLTKNQVFRRKDGCLVFVCGAKSNRLHPPARDCFVQYAKKHIREYEFFLAEGYSSQEHEDDNTDLLSLEGKLAEFADCVMVFVESESAIAELGAFANDSELVKKMLAINKVEFEGSDSFIAKGPVARINATSHFAPVIYTRMDSVLASSAIITERLKMNLPRRSRQLRMESFSAFLESRRKDRMELMFDLISLLGPVTNGELVHVMKRLFDGFSYDIRTELGMLRTLGLIRHVGEYRCHNPARIDQFMEYRLSDTVKLRSAVVRHFFQHERLRFRILGSQYEEVSSA